MLTQTDDAKERLAADEDVRGRNKHVYYYSERRVQLVGAVVSTLFSAVLLIGAIVCLSAISDRSLGLRTGMIVLFTCLFAAVVGLLTNARRAEIFGATAAYASSLSYLCSSDLCQMLMLTEHRYAAVLVVFATNGSDGKTS